MLSGALAKTNKSCQFLLIILLILNYILCNNIIINISSTILYLSYILFDKYTLRIRYESVILSTIIIIFFIPIFNLFDIFILWIKLIVSLQIVLTYINTITNIELFNIFNKIFKFLSIIGVNSQSFSWNLVLIIKKLLLILQDISGGEKNLLYLKQNIIEYNRKSNVNILKYEEKLQLLFFNVNKGRTSFKNNIKYEKREYIYIFLSIFFSIVG